MRTARVLLAAAGTAVAAYGAVLLLRQVQPTVPFLRSLGGWLFAGPVLHDLLVAPVVGAAGVALSRLVPGRWRGAVAAGLATTGTLALVAVPLLWRPHAAGTNPGLQDRAYLPGLLVFTAALWLVLLVAAAVRPVRRPAQPTPDRLS